MWDSEASGWFQSSGYRVKVSNGTNRSFGCAVSVTKRVVSSTAPFLWPMTRLVGCRVGLLKTVSLC